MIWRYHPEAAEEFLEACVHYCEISPELGRAFYSSIEGGIEKILAGPLTWPVIDDGVRRFLVNRFPYGIYYTLVDATAAPREPPTRRPEPTRGARTRPDRDEGRGRR